MDDGAAAAHDSSPMKLAIEAAESVRGTTAPNPWVGAVLVTADGERFVGATETPTNGPPETGGRHAEKVAIEAAQAAGKPDHSTKGATLYTTLEPCAHSGRTPPCTEAIKAAGIGKVIVALSDPDPQVSGTGIAALSSAGIETTLGAVAGGFDPELEQAAADQLAPYLHHRRSGRPWVTLKMAITIDGRIAASDASSTWITSEAARTDAHRLRARCDAVLVGAGTVRDDDPALTVRHCEGADPRRVVLGTAAPKAQVHPCWEMSGEVEDVLAELGTMPDEGGKGVVELLVEGGANVSAQFHQAGLVNEYVLYVAPALLGGSDGRPMFDGPGAKTIAEAWRGEITDIARLGPDLRITLKPVV